MQNALLDDLVYPTEIVGRRTRYRLDGSSVMKVCPPSLDHCRNAIMQHAQVDLGWCGIQLKGVRAATDRQLYIWRSGLQSDQAHV